MIRRSKPFGMIFRSASIADSNSCRIIPTRQILDFGPGLSYNVLGHLMIPKNITKRHVLKALEHIKKYGVPSGRGSRKFLLEHDGKSFPPKYVLSLANKYANGKDLDSEKFGGGKETNDFLSKLGFTVRSMTSTCYQEVHQLREARAKRDMKKTSPLRRVAHGERCPKCKETVARLLKAIYGEVETGWKACIGTKPEDFKNTPHYEKLREIYHALKAHRGFKDLVKAETLDECDYYVPSPGFVIEFDERQHFTTPRSLTLKQYSEGFAIGFDKARWMGLCERIDARDNIPPYRDEQRAWYDTLRDFLPTISGLKPTVRLYANDYVWCSLDPHKDTDLNIFRGFVEGKTAGEWKVEVIAHDNPVIGRVIITEEWPGDPEHAIEVLNQVFENWPNGVMVDFLITCGGFIQFDWPRSLTRNQVGDNLNPNLSAVEALVEKAKGCAKKILTPPMVERLRKVTNYLTLGIDSYKEEPSIAGVKIPELHVELVFLIDLPHDIIYWTGKSYPTRDQQDGLVRIQDLSSHFFQVQNSEKVMALGCHDLSAFNPMALMNPKTADWRVKVNREMQALAQNERPTVVLAHPHTTVKIRTWKNSWNNLMRLVPSVQKYAGAGVYYEAQRKPSQYDPLPEVLESTTNTPTLDFILQKYRH